MSVGRRSHGISCNFSPRIHHYQFAIRLSVWLSITRHHDNHHSIASSFLSIVLVSRVSLSPQQQQQQYKHRNIFLTTNRSRDELSGVNYRPPDCVWLFDTRSSCDAFVTWRGRTRAPSGGQRSAGKRQRNRRRYVRLYANVCYVTPVGVHRVAPPCGESSARRRTEIFRPLSACAARQHHSYDTSDLCTGTCLWRRSNDALFRQTRCMPPAGISAKLTLFRPSGTYSSTAATAGSPRWRIPPRPKLLPPPTPTWRAVTAVHLFYLSIQPWPMNVESEAHRPTHDVTASAVERKTGRRRLTTCMQAPRWSVRGTKLRDKYKAISVPSSQTSPRRFRSGRRCESDSDGSENWSKDDV